MYNRFDEEENIRRLKPNLDDWKEVINGEDTFKAIAQELIDYGRIIIGWTDQDFDHRDILFTYQPTKMGNLQGGLRWCYLYVSIIRYNSMGFLIEFKRDNIKGPGYIQEKLNLSNNSCDTKLCELINGVIHQIDLIEGNI